MSPIAVWLQRIRWRLRLWRDLCVQICRRAPRALPDERLPGWPGNEEEPPMWDPDARLEEGWHPLAVARVTEKRTADSLTFSVRMIGPDGTVHYEHYLLATTSIDPKVRQRATHRGLPRFGNLCVAVAAPKVQSPEDVPQALFLGRIQHNTGTPKEEGAEPPLYVNLVGVRPLHDLDNPDAPFSEEQRKSLKAAAERTENHLKAELAMGEVDMPEFEGPSAADAGLAVEPTVSNRRAEPGAA